MTADNAAASANANSAVPEMPRKRRRPPLSCIECRRRKIKCDRNVPCNHCLQSKNAECTYDARDAARSRLDSTTRKAHGESPTQNDAPGTSWWKSNCQLLASKQLGPHVNNQNPGETPSPSVDEPLSSQPTVHDLQERVRKLESRLSESLTLNKTSNPCDSGLGNRPKVRGNLGVLNKSRLYGRSHWMSHFDQFTSINAVKATPDMEKSSELTKLLEQCKKLARQVKARPKQSSCLPELTTLMPSRSICDELVHLYFRTFESTYRVLHEPSFYHDYVRYWDNCQSLDSTFVPILFLVMAIGSTFYQNLDDEVAIRRLSKQWVTYAYSWLDGPREKNRLNLAGLQIHCLLLIARQMCTVDADLVWISGGALVRMAIQMGYHTDPKSFPKIPVLVAEMRRRLWATILELEIQCSLEAGIPPQIHFDDFDVEPPANVDDIELSVDSKTLPRPKDISVYTQTTFQILLLRSLSTRVKIVKLLNHVRGEITYEETLALGVEMTSHLREAIKTVQNFTTPPTALRRNLFDLHNRRALLALHIPFAARAKIDPRYYFSRKMVLDTCVFIVTYSGIDEISMLTPNSTRSIPDPIPPNDDDYTRLKSIAGGFYKGSLIHAFSALCAEIITQMEEQASLAAPSLVSLTTPQSTLDDLVRQWRRRIEMGETNVRCYIFLSMVRGQVKAMESGDDVERSIVEAARMATIDSHELLKENAMQANPTAGPIECDAIVSTGDQDMGWDLGMQDTAMNLDIPDFWLFSSWENNNAFF